MIDQFVSKWSSWWCLEASKDQLNQAFKSELNDLIEIETKARIKLLIERLQEEAEEMGSRREAETMEDRRRKQHMRACDDLTGFDFISLDGPA